MGRLSKALLLGFVLVVGSTPAFAITIEAPFAGTYTFTDLGAVPELPTPYGGLTLKAGDQK